MEVDFEPVAQPSVHQNRGTFDEARSRANFDTATIRPIALDSIEVLPESEGPHLLCRWYDTARISQAVQRFETHLATPALATLSVWEAAVNRISIGCPQLAGQARQTIGRNKELSTHVEQTSASVDRECFTLFSRP